MRFVASKHRRVCLLQTTHRFDAGVLLSLSVARPFAAAVNVGASSLSFFVYIQETFVEVAYVNKSTMRHRSHQRMKQTGSASA